MYQFTLTSTEYPNHTVVNFDLWRFEEDGRRSLERLEHVFLPQPSGALFERSEMEFLNVVSLELEKFAQKKRDTGQ
uniref:Uncharacterized protein n=1 Tax=uncultured prokaryote TaxID=198431 RepID=A0A0H5PZ72_9ZZZZ|nr:hypothetical protein [uncultured prokaryote]